jgi:hypothetical protein
MFGNLLCNFVGNIAKWLFYFGAKSMDEVVKEDNSTVGFIVLTVFIFIAYSFQ